MTQTHPLIGLNSYEFLMNFTMLNVKSVGVMLCDTYLISLLPRLTKTSLLHK